MGGARFVVLALLAALVAVPPAHSTHDAPEPPPLVASVEMEGDGWARWTLRLDGATRLELRDSLVIDGTFGAVSMVLFDEAWDLEGFTTSYAYGERAALVRVNHLWVGTGGDSLRGASGGGMGGGCGSVCTGTLHVVAFAASTGTVERFSAELRADNATLLEEERHAGGTFAWTTRPAPKPGPTGLFGPSLEPAEDVPTEDARAHDVQGRLLGQFFHTGGADLSVVTPAGVRACDAPWGCDLHLFRDGPGEHVFHYANGSPRGHAYLFGADVGVP